MSPHRRPRILAALALTFAAQGALAQDAAGEIGAIQRLEREQVERLRQEQRLQQRPAAPGIDLPDRPARTAASAERNIAVKRFEVDASAILSEAQVRAVLAPYENRSVSLDDLFDAVAALNKLYDERQMPTARAVLPPQEIRDGVVRIRLVEAKVGTVNVQVQNQVTPSFVRERLQLEEGALLSVPQLEADLIRFNRLHQAQLRASVKAGAAPGTTDVELIGVEPQPYRFSAFTDNAGRSTVGTLRVGVQAQWNGLAGRDDSLTLSAAGSQGSQSLAAYYSVPIAADDTRLDVSFSQDAIHVIDGPFEPLNIGGRSHAVSVGLTRPLLVDANRLWRGYVRLSDKTSTSTFGGVVQQKTELLVLTLGVTGDLFIGNGVWTNDINLNQGLNSGNAGRFTALRANTAWLNPLGQRTQLVLRGGLQYSPTDLLPSMEQFQLGGSVSVRGYSEGLLTGRSGYLLSAELRHLLRASEPGSLLPGLTGLLFVDHGGAFPYRPSPLKDVTRNDFLSSAGIGFTADWGQRMQARVTLGWPLRDNPAETERRRPRVHATLSVSWP